MTQHLFKWFIPGSFYFKCCLCPSLLTTICHDSPTTHWRTDLLSAHRSFPLSVELLWIHPMLHIESQNITFRVHSTSNVPQRRKSQHTFRFLLGILVRNQAQPQKQRSHSSRKDPANPFQCSISFLPTVLAREWPNQPKCGSRTLFYGSPGRKSGRYN